MLRRLLLAFLASGMYRMASETRYTYDCKSDGRILGGQALHLSCRRASIFSLLLFPILFPTHNVGEEQRATSIPTGQNGIGTVHVSCGLEARCARPHSGHSAHRASGGPYQQRFAGEHGFVESNVFGIIYFFVSFSA